MHLVNRKAAPAPRWLASRQWLYTAALQRFWLEHFAQSALVRPVQSVGHDMRDLDDKVLSHLVGMPERRRAGAAEQGGDGRDSVIRGHGIAGRLLMWCAERLHHLEGYLVLQRAEGPLTRLLRGAGDYLRALEALLEQPRYLILLVAATFVVIL
jgi:hypothetical protein